MIVWLALLVVMAPPGGADSSAFLPLLQEAWNLEVAQDYDEAARILHEVAYDAALPQGAREHALASLVRVEITRGNRAEAESAADALLDLNLSYQPDGASKRALEVYETVRARRGRVSEEVKRALEAERQSGEGKDAERLVADLEGRRRLLEERERRVREAEQQRARDRLAEEREQREEAERAARRGERGGAGEDREGGEAFGPRLYHAFSGTLIGAGLALGSVLVIAAAAGLLVGGVMWAAALPIVAAVLTGLGVGLGVFGLGALFTTPTLALVGCCGGALYPTDDATEPGADDAPTGDLASDGYRY